LGGLNSAWYVCCSGARQIHRPARRARSTSWLNLDIQHHIHPAAKLGQQSIQGQRLRDGARETIQHRPTRRIRLLEPLADHGDGHVVGHQLAAVHVLRASWPNGVLRLRLSRNRSPEATCCRP
jgi:hypothetical protein